MPPSLGLAVAVGTAVLALATACGGGGGDTGLGELTKADLAIMPLPPSALGTLVDDLEIDPDESGFQTAADQAEDTSDPNDDAADLERQGYVDGYDLSLLAERFDTTGVVYVASGVAEFTTSEEARAFLERTVAYDESHVGEELVTGVELLSAERFDVGEVGDHAIGTSQTAIVAGSRLTETGVLLTVGRLAAGFSIVHTGDTTAREDAVRHARALDARIRTIAAGELDEEPVRIPKADTATIVDADETLKPLALSIDDLPRGARVVREEFVDDAGDTALEREFEFRLGTTVGASKPANVESIVERLETASEAAFFISVLESTVQSSDLEEFVRSEFGAELGERGAVTLKTVQTRGIGDSATGFRGTFRTSYGTIEAVFVYLSAGRVVGQLYVLAPVGQLQAADALALARKMAARMRQDG